jgi:4-cresol dehydrogenase (hydroxylating)
VDALAGLYRDGIVTTVTHIGNRHRTEIALAPLIRAYLEQRGKGDPDGAEGVRAFLRAEGYGDWSGITGLQGTRGMVRAALAEVRRALRGIARPMVLTDSRVERLTRVARGLRWIPWFDRKLAVLPSVAEIQGLAAGVPTSEPMRSLYWAIGATPPAGDAIDPDHGPCGILYFAPMMPLNGATCREAAALIEDIFAGHDFTPYVTFNVLDARTLEAVINVSFDREQPAQTDRAEATIDALHGAFRKRGWLPYRLGIRDMAGWVRRGDPFWEVAAQLKTALDPDGILSPGRYSLR